MGYLEPENTQEVKRGDKCPLRTMNFDGWYFLFLDARTLKLRIIIFIILATRQPEIILQTPRTTKKFSLLQSLNYWHIEWV